MFLNGCLTFFINFSRFGEVGIHAHRSDNGLHAEFDLAGDDLSQAGQIGFGHVVSVRETGFDAFEKTDVPDGIGDDDTHRTASFRRVGKGCDGQIQRFAIAGDTDGCRFVQMLFHDFGDHVIVGDLRAADLQQPVTGEHARGFCRGTRFDFVQDHDRRFRSTDLMDADGEDDDCGEQVHRGTGQQDQDLLPCGGGPQTVVTRVVEFAFRLYESTEGKQVQSEFCPFPGE